jgi:hypothetical protein
MPVGKSQRLQGSVFDTITHCRLFTVLPSREFYELRMHGVLRSSHTSEFSEVRARICFLVTVAVMLGER